MASLLDILNQNVQNSHQQQAQNLQQLQVLDALRRQQQSEQINIPGALAGALGGAYAAPGTDFMAKLTSPQALMGGLSGAGTAPGSDVLRNAVSGGLEGIKAGMTYNKTQRELAAELTPQQKAEAYAATFNAKGKPDLKLMTPAQQTYVYETALPAYQKANAADEKILNEKALLDLREQGLKDKAEYNEKNLQRMIDLGNAQMELIRSKIGAASDAAEKKSLTNQMKFLSAWQAATNAAQKTLKGKTEGGVPVLGWGASPSDTQDKVEALAAKTMGWSVDQVRNMQQQIATGLMPSTVPAVQSVKPAGKPEFTPEEIEFINNAGPARKDEAIKYAIEHRTK
jgi:hypothetical protein